VKHILAACALLILAAPVSTSLAESKTKSLGPDAIVKNLYQVHNAGDGPFFQTRNRALVDRYFMKDLADLLWKDAVHAKGEVGALDFDPLYASQDPQISDFKISESGWAAGAKFGPEDKAIVEVTFKNLGKKQRVAFAFDQDKSGAWKIFDIRYPDHTSLREVFASQ